MKRAEIVGWFAFGLAMLPAAAALPLIAVAGLR